MITGFIVENLLHRILKPVEDSYRFSQKRAISLAVADGVTRDFIGGKPATRSFGSLLKFLLGYYPNPSPAKEASDIFTLTFTQTNFSSRDSIEEVKMRFELANSNIRDYNKTNFPNPNYLDRDLAGCTAAGALISNRDVFYGFICDCGIAFFDEKGNLVEKTKPEMFSGKSLIPSFNWSNPNHRILWRSDYRNNPSNPNSFGVLTGEPKALTYLRTNYHELKDKELIILYTDGLENILQEGKFRDNLREGASRKDFSQLRRFCRKRVSSEGTAIIYAS